MAWEREIKLALTGEEARTLARRLGPPFAVRQQRNHYFDTLAGELRQRQHGLRLREEEATGFTVTLKGPSQIQDGVTVRREDERAVTAEEARHWLAAGATLREIGLPLREELIGIGGDARVCCLGMLANERRSFQVRAPHVEPGEAASVPGGDRASDAPRGVEFVLEIDRSVHADGTVEWELEVELDDEAAAAVRAGLQAWLAHADVPWRPQTRGKFRRFLEHAGIVNG